MYTDDPATLLEEIMGYAEGHHNRVVSATTLGPTLEDVFIRLTGLEKQVRGGGGGE
jgi:ABC-2 type transport system ATP-binding protein